VLTAILAVVIWLQLKTQLFTGEFGGLLGASIGLNILATALWEATNHAPYAYRRCQKTSLDAALPKTGDERRKIFNRNKSIFDSDDSEARNKLLDVLFGKTEYDENIIESA
jgi:hypothetical protein